MMKKHIFLFLFLFVANIGQAQKEDTNWILGGGSERTFDGPQAMYQVWFSDTMEYEKKKIRFAMDATNASISDNSGNLVCYTNGTFLNNGAHEPIENGGAFQDTINYEWGFRMPQGALILPVPEQMGKYIFLLADFFYYRLEGILVAASSPLTYSMIDMSENGGSGKVIEKRVQLNTDTLAPGHLTAVRHGNGRDWWIITSKYRTNKYYRYLLDPEGIHLEGTQIVGDTAWTSLGQAVFSPDGNWYARFNWHGVTTINDRKRVDIYRFDRCTGLLSDHRHEDLPGIGAPGGVAFSENSRFLYASAWDTIYQYDTQAPDVLASRTVVAEYDGFIGTQGASIRFFTMQLAPNGKIYICIPNTNSQYFHSIENPDEKGTACNVQQHSVRFPFYNTFSIPNMPYFRLDTLKGSVCDTIKVSSNKELFAQEEKIQIFPNPSFGEINVSLPDDVREEGLRLTILNAAGIKFFETELSRGSKQYSLKLSPGMYFYFIRGEGNRKVKAGKLIIVESP